MASQCMSINHFSVDSSSYFRSNICHLCSNLPRCVYFCYFKIYTIVRHHSVQIRQIQTAVHNNELVTKFASLRKSAVGTFYVYAVFVLCYTPHVFSLISITTGVGSATVMKGAYLYSLTLTFLNSSLNPVIYCWKMRHIRRAMMDTLRNLLPGSAAVEWSARRVNKESPPGSAAGLS